MDFEGKKVLVTGGTRGLGRATVEAFLANGAHVAVNGRSEESVAKAIEEVAGVTVAAPGDITTASGCEQIVGRAVEGLGGLDVLVNNAGSGGGGLIEVLDEAIWSRVIDTNLKGALFVTKHALPALKAAAGAIVNISSVGALQGSVGSTIYNASSGGLVSMTRSMAIEFAPEVRVNAVLPGPIDTEMLQAYVARNPCGPEAGLELVARSTAVKRVARPDEIADAILYLASPRASYVTGTFLTVDGGMTAGRLNMS
jgi:meso-butanediol dehydrogenase/(S,S)-butanediol dehydrogenase/diacetyl reductase